MNNPPLSVQGKRLLCSPVKVADIGDLFAFLGDASAMQFTHCDQTITDCQARVMAFEARRETDGFAPWVVRLHENQRIIGWGGLYIDPFDPDWGPEIGYFFHPDVWGQGLASELAGLAIDYARTQTALTTLTAFAHPENASSAKLLTKLGFSHVGFVRNMRRDHFRLILSHV
ncbi:MULTISPECIES: GNAT family N-acetyltransferase [Thalassospira]|uniref:Acetyltransferase n=2 Tax=Thalassospira TaxID=168934 RepID=A0A367WBU4_9PROT|nr:MULTISPECIES: GNAT family N-acetyltransferase [Thalassospira]MDG4718250.1 GNAT family N-acetyltransferase [Thalassospira sp. FZY0004]RCK38002.1 acetyltransferase [Thalassospira profundimaris]